MARQVDPSVVFESFAYRRANESISVGQGNDRFSLERSHHRILEEGRKAIDSSPSVSVLGELQAKQLVELEQRWSEYYKAKRIESTLLEALVPLLQSSELPENPFIELCNVVRFNEIRQGLMEEKQAREQVRILTEVGATDAGSGLSFVEGERCLWGLPHCLSLVDSWASSSILDYLVNVEHVLSSFSDEQGDYKIRVVTGLSGSVIFAGKVMPFLPEHIDLNTDFVADGRKLENAIKLFANALIKNAYELERSADVVFFGIKIMPPGSSRYVASESEERTKTWTTAKARGAKASFVSAVKAATVGKRIIYLDFIVRSTCLRLQSVRYVSVRKYFSFHFRHQKSGKASEFAVQSFCIHPLGNLFLGLYHDKEDAIFYADLFRARGNSERVIALDSSDKRFVAFKNDLKVALSKAYIEGEIVLSIELLLCLCIFNLDGTRDVWGSIISFMWSTAGKLRSLIRQNVTLQRVVEVMLDRERGETKPGRGRRSKSLRNEEIFESFASYRKDLLDLVFSRDSSEMDALSKLTRHMLYDMTNHVSRELVLNSQTAERFREVRFMCEALESTIARDVFQVLNEKDETNTDDKLSIQDMLDMILEQVNALSGSALSNGAGGELREIAKAAINELKAAERARNTQLVVNVAEEARRNVHRKGFPIEISEPGTVLQYIGDTRIDMALQNIISEVFLNGKLLPNPFPFIVELLSAEAARHSLWRENDTQLSSLLNWSPIHAVLSHPRDYIFKANKKQRVILDEDEAFSLHGSRSAVQLCHERSLVELLTFLKPLFCSIFDHVFKERRVRYNSMDISINTALGGEALLFSRLHRIPSPLESLGRLSTFTLYEQHVFKGGAVNSAIDMFAEIVLVHATHIHEKSENVLLAICTGEQAMHVLNEDPGNDANWRTLVSQSTTNESARYARTPIYTSGMRMSLHFLHRDREGATRELVRAVKNSEPVVVSFALLISGESADPFYVTVQKQVGLFFVEDRSNKTVSFLPPFLHFEALYKGIWLDGKQGASASRACRSSDGLDSASPDPLCPESKSFSLVKGSLQEKAGTAFDKGQIFSASKVLLRLAVLENNKGNLADLVRIFKPDSLCQELASLIAQTENLQLLLEERTKHEELRVKMNRKVLQEQVGRFCTRVEDVLARADCFYFHGIRNSIHSLLHKAQTVLQGDRTGKSTLHAEYLAELKVYLVCIQTSAAQAVFRNCAALQDECATYAKSNR